MQHGLGSGVPLRNAHLTDLHVERRAGHDEATTEVEPEEKGRHDSDEAIELCGALEFRAEEVDGEHVQRLQADGDDGRSRHELEPAALGRLFDAIIQKANAIPRTSMVATNPPSVFCSRTYLAAAIAATKATAYPLKSNDDRSGLSSFGGKTFQMAAWASASALLQV